jgi:hypothetical protein
MALAHSPNQVGPGQEGPKRVSHTRRVLEVGDVTDVRNAQHLGVPEGSFGPRDVGSNRPGQVSLSIRPVYHGFARYGAFQSARPKARA